MRFLHGKSVKFPTANENVLNFKKKINEFLLH